MTQVYDRLTEQQKREVRMYGVTVEGMRESIESSITSNHNFILWTETVN